LADAIRASFNQAFFKPETGQYSTGSEGSNAVPYVMNIVEPQNRSSVLNGIVDDLKKHGNSFTTGEVTYRYLLRALADAGRSDLVFEINNQSEKPGYGMQIAKGCTSLTERWDAAPTVWSSQDHFMSGQIVEWLYHDLAGLQREEDVPAFKKIVIKPAIVGDFTWVRASYDSIQGKIVSEWKRDGQSHHAACCHSRQHDRDDLRPGQRYLLRQGKRKACGSIGRSQTDRDGRLFCNLRRGIGRLHIYGIPAICKLE
jgi:alpha-L-rhamnosidase